MKRALRIVAITAGLVSVISTVVLGCVYLEEMASNLKVYKDKIVDKIVGRRSLTDEYDPF